MINLLPQQYKEALRYEEQFRLTVILGSLGIIFLICVSLLFVAIRIFASGSLGAQDILIGTQQQEYEQGTSPAEQIRVANGEIASLSSFYERQILVSDVVDEVAREVVDTLPEGAYVTSFAYRYSVPVARTRLNDDEGGGKVSISGFVPFREDLSAFRDSIESNPKFSNFSFPPSNWVDAVDIDFSFTFEVKKFTL